MDRSCGLVDIVDVKEMLVVKADKKGQREVLLYSICHLLRVRLPSSQIANDRDLGKSGLLSCTSCVSECSVVSPPTLEFLMRQPHTPCPPSRWKSSAECVSRCGVEVTTCFHKKRRTGRWLSPEVLKWRFSTRSFQDSQLRCLSILL